MADHMVDNQGNQQKQLLKTRNKQPEYNKDVINEDSFYKLLAYNGMLQKKRTENKEATMDDPTMAAGFESFDSMYQQTLLEDAKKPQREIDPEVFRPKMQMISDQSMDKKEITYMNQAARREEYLEEHTRYKENKLEQQERIELFYLLE